MNSTADNDKLKQKQTDYLIIGIGLTFIFLALLLLLGFQLMARETAVPPTPASHLIADPMQWATARDEPVIFGQDKNNQWQIIPRAHLQMGGRVLSRKTYRNWPANISPLDLALGWGELGDPQVDQWVNWRQSNRWYHYSWEDDSPYDADYLRLHSSNVHIIPATPNLAEALLKIKEDDQVFLEGLLVDIEATQGDRKWRNSTSLSRSDSGNGACEILYVKRLTWNGQTYQ